LGTPGRGLRLHSRLSSLSRELELGAEELSLERSQSLHSGEAGSLEKARR